MTTRILVGDVRDRLRELPDQSVHCCVTSPPYYGLRDYGVPGQLGLERTLPEYIVNMVDVFREVRRVLRDDGTLWLNIGDSYATGAGSVGNCPGGGVQGERWKGNRGDRPGSPKHTAGSLGPMTQPNRLPRPGLKPKDLMMVPARLALALVDDGWYLRSDIIWAKPNPMPESVTDRPTSAHEHIFLLTKSRTYWYDADAVRTPSSMPALNNGYSPPGQSPHTGGQKVFNGKHSEKQRGHGRRHDGFNARWDAMTKEDQQATGANLRNVWTIATKPFSEAHFATFPTEIPRRCILAGCPKGGTVLDPFGGSGTTGMVADQLERDCYLIELNPEYALMSERRIRGDAPMFAAVSVEPATHAHANLERGVA